MRVLVWQWGRRGGGPRFAAELAGGLQRLGSTTALLSLSAQAELLRLETPPPIDLRFPTYRGWPELLSRVAAAPWLIRGLTRSLVLLAPDAAVVALPALLDPLMTAALARLGIPYAAVIHDAANHPGDRFFLEIAMQRRLAHRAALVVALTEHVAAQLLAAKLVEKERLLVVSHPPVSFGAVPPRQPHAGPFRLLFFGRLRRYKGLDLLAQALARLPAGRFAVRIVGHGPPGPELAALARLDGVKVENRWVPEAEIALLFAWADAVVLPYREASQSGVAAAALAAGRPIVATSVGGLTEQLAGEGLARLTAPDPAALADGLMRLAEEPAPGQSPPPTGDAWTTLASELLGALAKIPGAA